MSDYINKRPPRARLFDLYVTQKLSTPTIAKMIGVNHRYVREWMVDDGIPRRSNSEAQKLLHNIDERQVYDLYVVQKMSQKRVGEILGISQSAVGKIALRNGWPIRSKSHPGKKNPMYGRTHTPEAREKIRQANKRQFATAQAREQHGRLTAQAIRDGKHPKQRTVIERITASILDDLGLDYQPQFVLDHFAYDFKVDNLLIECDGTFWHADPRFYDHDNLSAIQRRNTWNDRRKNECAKMHGFGLLRLWEYDIKSDPKGTRAKIDAAKQRYDSEQRGRAADAAKADAGQLSLWDMEKPA